MTESNLNFTGRQARFCLEYVVDQNGTQAAIRAGYSPKTARQIAAVLLTNTNVKEGIKKNMTKIEEKTWLNKEYILDGLRSNYEKSSEAIPVLDKKGQPTGEYRYDSSGANKALELLGKHLAIFTDNVHHGGEVKLEKIERVIIDPLQPGQKRDTFL